MFRFLQLLRNILLGGIEKEILLSQLSRYENFNSPSDFSLQFGKRILQVSGNLTRKHICGIDVLVSWALEIFGDCFVAAFKARL